MPMPQPEIDDILAEEQQVDEAAAADDKSKPAGDGSDGGGDDQENKGAAGDDGGDGVENGGSGDGQGDQGDGEETDDGTGNDDDDGGDSADKGKGETGDDESDTDTDKPKSPEVFEEKDLFIEVEGYVGDSDEVTKIKVRSYQDVPADFRYKDSQAFAKFQQEFTQLQRDQETQSTKKAAYEEAQEAEQIQNTVLKRWDGEIKDLTKSGRLPEIKARANSSELDKDPAVVRQNEVFKFITTENAKRAQNGMPPITSFEDALDKIELREMRAKAEADNKKSDDVRKKKSGFIGKGTPTSKGGGGKENAYIRGSGMSPMDILAEEQEG